jgi:two-component system response regulator YesN
MYKVLAADDEGIVREALQFIFEKDFGASCTLFLAKNGRQAIELCEQEHPDIVLLDIQMHGINGLTALREIRKNNPKVKALILTAFDNFDYAKEAMELGTADYLMKPVDRKKIDEAVTKLMREIDEERKRRQEDLSIREKMDAVVPIIESGFVQSLIVQDEYGYSGRQYRTLLDIKEDYGFIIALEWGDSVDNAVGADNPVGAGVRARKFSDKMKALIRTYFGAYMSDIMGNKLIIVVPSEKERLSYEERLQMIERTRSLVTALREMADVAFKAGIGSIRSWDDMFDSYQEALRAVRFGVRHVTHIDDLVSQAEPDRQNEITKKALLDDIRRGQEMETKREADVYFDHVMRLYGKDISDVKLKLLEAVLEGRQLLISQGKSPDHAYGENLMRGETKEALALAFDNDCMDLAREIRVRTPRTDTAIGRAKEYIQRNFTKDISLDSVAQAVSISPYYFSKLFKEETGTNFSDYLTELRINRAKQLLDEDPDRNIKEISIESGYSNPNYFSRIFKKWTGSTPTERRQETQRK